MDIRLFPSRILPSGTVALAAGANDLYPGDNGRQKRRQFIVTNLDAANPLKLRTANGYIFATVWPQTSWTVETEADIQVYNPNGVSVNYEVGEVFYDAGTPGSPTSAFPAAGGGASGGGGGSLGGYAGSGSTGGLTRER